MASDFLADRVATRHQTDQRLVPASRNRIQFFRHRIHRFFAALRRACGQALGPASRLSGGHPFGPADFRRAFRQTGRLDSGVGQE